MSRDSLKIPRLVCLVGATGTGKTAAALHLAAALGGGIVNFDSRQVYRDFPIITAQPTPEEQKRHPHLLYGVYDCHRRINASAFVDEAVQAIRDVVRQGLLPILVGGTGFYLKTLLEGLSPLPDVPDAVRQNLLRRCETEGPEVLHRSLARVDPVAAERIAPKDRQRIVRALEVFKASGKPLTWWQGRRESKLPETKSIKIGVWMDLAELKPRLSARIDAMLDEGALDEAQEAWRRCPDPEAPAWSGIGCAELLEVVRGKSEMAAARKLWLRNTRAYAKRQITWFKRDSSIRWFSPDAYAAMEQEVASWLRIESAY